MKKMYGLEVKDAPYQTGVCLTCHNRIKATACSNCHEFENYSEGDYVNIEAAIRSITKAGGGYKVSKRGVMKITFVSKKFNNDSFSISAALRVQDFADVISDLTAQHTLWR